MAAPTCGPVTGIMLSRAFIVIMTKIGAAAAIVVIFADLHHNDDELDVSGVIPYIAL